MWLAIWLKNVTLHRDGLSLAWLTLAQHKATIIHIWYQISCANKWVQVIKLQFAAEMCRVHEIVASSRGIIQNLKPLRQVSLPAAVQRVKIWSTFTPTVHVEKSHKTFVLASGKMSRLSCFLHFSLNPRKEPSACRPSALCNLVLFYSSHSAQSLQASHRVRVEVMSWLELGDLEWHNLLSSEQSPPISAQMPGIFPCPNSVYNKKQSRKVMPSAGSEQ